MSDKKTDGGPAFPTSVVTPFGDGRTAEGGMTLRDWFAGMAMQGMSGDAELMATAEEIAKWAYEQADAMLAARSD